MIATTTHPPSQVLFVVYCITGCGYVYGIYDPNIMEVSERERERESKRVEVMAFSPFHV